MLSTRLNFEDFWRKKHFIKCLKLSKTKIKRYEEEQKFLTKYIKAFPPECCWGAELWEKPNSELLQAKSSSWGENLLFVNFSSQFILHGLNFHIIITIFSLYHHHLLIYHNILSSEPKQSDRKQEREKRRVWRCSWLYAHGIYYFNSNHWMKPNCFFLSLIILIFDEIISNNDKNAKIQLDLCSR